MKAFLQSLHALPTGYFRGLYEGAVYGITIKRLAGGRQIKLFGEELGGADYISFNLYLTSSGKTLLKPCEMPAEKVMAFVEDLRVVG